MIETIQLTDPQSVKIIINSTLPKTSFLATFVPFWAILVKNDPAKESQKWPTVAKKMIKSRKV